MELTAIYLLGLPAFLYVRAVAILKRRGRRVPVWQQAAWFGGLALIGIALLSPLDHLGDTDLVSAHMAQHLVLADLAALLIVLGLTGPLLQPILAHRTMQRLRVLFHPAVALPLWALNLYVWHLPALYQAALGSQPVHALQHACFIGFGVCMWMALLGPLPAPSWFGNGARLVYVVAVRLAGALLGNIFIWSGSVFYPDYRRGQAYWNISPLHDQGIAGTIMMVEGSVVTIVLIGWLFLKTAREAEERQELVEYA